MKTERKGKAAPPRAGAAKGKPAAKGQVRKAAPRGAMPAAPKRHQGPRGRTIVVYFSRFGATAAVAQEIARELGAEVREIKAARQQSWPAMGFGAIFSLRYPIQPMDVDFTAARSVVLCSPIWAGKPACQVMTFLDAAKLAGTRSAVVLTTWDPDTTRAAGWLEGVLRAHGSEPVASRQVLVRGVSEEQLKAGARALFPDLAQRLSGR